MIQTVLSRALIRFLVNTLVFHFFLTQCNFLFYSKVDRVQSKEVDTLAATHILNRCGNFYFT